MTRNEYLNQLKIHLTSLSEQELEDVLDYFEEYFADRGDDIKAIQELGAPKDAANEILRNLGKEQESDKQNEEDVSYTDLGANIRNAVHQYLNSSFLKKILKDTDVSININGKSDTIQTEPVKLPHLQHIQLNINDTNLIVSQTETDTPQLRFEVEKEQADIALPYHFENGKLLIQCDDTIEKIIIELPSSYVLQQMTATLEDANASIKGIKITTLSVQAEDTNLAFSHLEIAQLIAHLEDSNLSLVGSHVTNGRLKAERSNLTIHSNQFNQISFLTNDSNLTLSKNDIIHLIQIEMEDSHLTIERGEETNVNYSIESIDSTLHFADDLRGDTHFKGDTTSFHTHYDNCSATLTIQCEDSYVTIV